MVYKNFRLNCIIRISFLAATILLFLYLLFRTQLIASTAIVGVIIFLQAVSLIHYIEKTNRMLTRFLDTIRYSDFAQSFSDDSGGRSFAELNAAFGDVVDRFRQARSEKEEHYRYLQTVVQHVGIGLITFQPDGTVGLINASAKKLLQIQSLDNISELKSISRPLAETLLRLKSGEKALVKVHRNNELLQLAVYAAEFILRRQKYVLVSIQNITSELAEKEMEAWQSLVRVLTHEIMNSVTPISSLAGTVSNLLIADSSTGNKELKKEIGPDTIVDIENALRTIQKRSGSLLNFVESYRNPTRLPKPEFKVVKISEIFERVAQLMKTQLSEKKIEFVSDILPESLDITADPGMIEQVIINLVLNAIQAVEECQNPKVEMNAHISDRGNILIQVSDNGAGIPEESLEKIFIPFYTTKKDGSGIGLSLSRQIMRLHHGSITVTSEPNQQTVFTLKF